MSGQPTDKSRASKIRTANTWILFELEVKDQCLQLRGVEPWPRFFTSTTSSASTFATWLNQWVENNTKCRRWDRNGWLPCVGVEYRPSKVSILPLCPRRSWQLWFSRKSVDKILHHLRLFRHCSEEDICNTINIHIYPLYGPQAPLLEEAFFPGNNDAINDHIRN